MKENSSEEVLLLKSVGLVEEEPRKGFGKLEQKSWDRRRLKLRDEAIAEQRRGACPKREGVISWERSTSRVEASAGIWTNGQARLGTNRGHTSLEHIPAKFAVRE